MNWDYYESVDRFQRILDAHGITEALKENGAKEGDLVMIGAGLTDCGALLRLFFSQIQHIVPPPLPGEWDFTYNDRRNQWLTELGVDDIKPRRRYSMSDGDP
jgi:hypothetical protein